MQQNVKLEVVRGEDGKDYLYTPFMCLSDVHLGTKHSRAKWLCRFLENTKCDTLVLAGDIVDLIAMRNKQRWNFPHYHRQVIAHFIRKAAEGTKVIFLDGNHERGSYNDILTPERRNPAGKSIFGIEFHNEVFYMAPDNRNYLIIHGDKLDGRVNRLYALGNTLYTTAYHLDSTLHGFGIEESFSLAAIGKKRIRKFINKHLKIRQNVVDMIESIAECDGIIYGHSHMGGFDHTESGKVICNDGCCTEHVNVLVHDKDGNLALLTPLKDKMLVLEENGEEADLDYKSIGLDHFIGTPTSYEDQYTDQADRIIRLIFRLAPPIERSVFMYNLKDQREYVEIFNERSREMPQELLKMAQAKLKRMETQTANPVRDPRRTAHTPS